MLGLESEGAESGNAESLSKFILDKKKCTKKLLFPRGKLAKVML